MWSPETLAVINQKAADLIRHNLSPRHAQEEVGIEISKPVEERRQQRIITRNGRKLLIGG